MYGQQTTLLDDCLNTYTIKLPSVNEDGRWQLKYKDLLLLMIVGIL